MWTAAKEAEQVLLNYAVIPFIMLGILLRWYIPITDILAFEVITVVRTKAYIDEKHNSVNLFR